MIRPLLLAIVFLGPFACGSGSSESTPDKSTSPRIDNSPVPVVTAEKSQPADASLDSERPHHESADDSDSHVPPTNDVEPLGHRFKDADKWAKRFDRPTRDRWQKPAEVIMHMQIAEGMRVVDIGAGTGYFLAYLSKAVGAQGTVLGLDIEKDMVRYMTERAEREKLANVTARIAGTTEPRLPASSVDRILIVNTWHHLPQRVEYAKKLAASLSKEGSITIVDFTMKTSRGPRKSHRVPAATILSELRDAGLSAELVKDKLPDQFIIIAKHSK